MGKTQIESSQRSIDNVLHRGYARLRGFLRAIRPPARTPVRPKPCPPTVCYHLE